MDEGKSKDDFVEPSHANTKLIEQEQKEVEAMLEKKSFLECSNGMVKPLDVIASEAGCQEKCNGSSGTASCHDETIADFKLNESIVTDISSTEGHLAPTVYTGAVSSTCTTTMDNKCSIGSSGCNSNSCISSCSQSCNNTQTLSTTCSDSGICESSNQCSSSNSSVIVSLSSSRDNTQDVGMQHQPASDNPSDASSVASNKENAPPPQSSCSENEITPMSAISNMVGATTTAIPTTASIQPLPSNMVNKTPFPLETQYMQQQSQIFVFSTELANKAAESYLSGHFPSIIAFHCAQPGTKSFLEKYPLKVQQFNRQNPAAWLNTLASMKQGGRPIKGPMNQCPAPHDMNGRYSGPLTFPPSVPCAGPCSVHGSHVCSSPRGHGVWPTAISGNNVGHGIHADMCNPGGSQAWPIQQFAHGTNPRFPNTIPQGPQGIGIRHANLPCNNSIGCSNAGPHLQGSGLCPASLQAVGASSTLTGVKIPDENLTPQQRQHREEQLAMIRKMHQLLFPEQQQLDQTQNSGNISSKPNVSHIAGGMLPQGSARFTPSGDICTHSGIETCFSPHHHCMNDHEHLHPVPDMFTGFHQQNFSQPSATAQLEWQKLQHQFYEEHKKKSLNTATYSLTSSTPGIPSQSQQTFQHQNESQAQLQQQQTLSSPSPNMGLSPGNRAQGPPPPYHQTSKKGLPSPHPSSPNPSSFSLSSPRMVSGLPSPADSRQFPYPTPPGSRLSHPSPGPTTPAGSNSLHTTPLNSPKPLNSSSGPGSNSCSALIKTPTTPSNTTTPSSTPTNSGINTLPNSGPSTPVSQCSQSRKQNQQCLDGQDTNSVASVSSNSSSDFVPVSSTASTPNNAQSDIFCSTPHQCPQSTVNQDQCAAHPTTLCNKEPSLMPVPSPQQIQYLNAFDGQELTIQKQPNTSIRELDMMSSTSLPSSMTLSTGSHPHFQSPESTSFPNTPGSCPTLENSQDSLSGRYPSSAPASVEGMQRFTVTSPQMPNFDSSHHMMPSTQDSITPRFPQNVEMLRVSGPGSLASSNNEEANLRFSSQPPHGSVFNAGAVGNMDNYMRFPANTSEAVRFRGPSPHNVTPVDMLQSRFLGSSSHISGIENLPQSTTPFNNSQPEILAQSFSSPAQTVVTNSSPCMSRSCTNESNVTHSHLQSLQKMTPPFENIIRNKTSSEVTSPVGSCSNLSTGTPFIADCPLTSSTQTGTSRLTHFDPIASMAAMSDSTGPLVSAIECAQVPQNMISSNINISGISGTYESDGNSHSNMINFNPSMQPPRSAVPCNVAGGAPNQFNASAHMTHPNCGNQAIHSAYNAVHVHPHNAHINASSFSPNTQMSSLNPHIPILNPSCHENGATTLSCSITTHPIVHSAVTTKSSPVNMCGGNIRSSFPGQPVPQRNCMPFGGALSPPMMARTSGTIVTSLNSANIQVKASAPNTIQYLPARPQNPVMPTNRSPTLEFLQRFAAPLTNLDNKIPTHNLQYFPSNRPSNIPSGHGGTIMSAPCGLGPSGMPVQRPVNMMGPVMRGVSPIMHSGNTVFPSVSTMPVSEPPLYGRPQCPPGAQLNSQVVPVNSIPNNQSLPVFHNKQMPLPMGGVPPDATQPLPPSMGQTFNYKQSPYYSATMADPNYAAQYHNFQQQLYATNTRGSQMNAQNNLTEAGFFGPK